MSTLAARVPSRVIRSAGSIGARWALAVVAAAVVAVIAIVAAGLSPGSTLDAIVTSALGSSFGIHDCLIQAVPITLAGLGVTVAYRAGLFNLGGEGQIYLGALAAILVALALPHAAPALAVPVILLAGTLAGAAWGALAGALKAYLRMSEIITTIMLNFIATYLVYYLVRGPMKDPGGLGYPYTKPVPPAGQLFGIGAAIPTGAIICLVATGLVWVLLERSRLGLRLTDLGLGPLASRFAGARTSLLTVAALALSGGLAGLAGAAELTGDELRLQDGFSPGWGFDAVAVALIGRGRAFGTLAAGLAIGALRSGIDGAQATANLPDSVAQIVQGAVVLFLVVANADVLAGFLRRLRTRRAEGDARPA